MMRTGEGPRKDTGKGQGATEQSATASDQSGANPALDSDHLAIMKQIGEYVLVHPDGEPFLPEDEMADPRLRLWREILRRKYNFKR